MRAFAQEAFGERGSIREVEVAEPQAGEVRIRVVSASVNPVDWKTGLGYLKDWLEHKFPLVLGQDLSGVVDAVGPGVSDFKVGDEVFGGHGQPYMGRGTFATQVIAAPRALAIKPTSLSHVQASSIGLAAVTALMSVDALGEIRGEPIVILGAAGGVGGYAVQIAAGRGAKVIGIASARNHDYIRELGASEAVDYTTGDIGEAIRSAHPDGVAGAIHLAGEADELSTVVSVVRDGGTVVSPAGASPIDADRIQWGVFGADITRERLTQLAEMVSKGDLKLPPTKDFAFDEISSAFDESAAGHVRGKLLIKVGAAERPARAMEVPGVVS
jgi:NADPH:quinone reductase-like Zn-dependent oxidoreductase